MKPDHQDMEQRVELLEELIFKLTKALETSLSDLNYVVPQREKPNLPKSIKSKNDCTEYEAHLTTLLDHIKSLCSENHSMHNDLKIYRRLFENARDLIYRYEIVPQSRFTYVSPSAQEITGYSPEEHYADPALGYKLVHPEDIHLLEELFSNVQEIKKPLIIRWIRKDGHIIWCEQRNVPVFDSQGSLVAIEGVARDITAIKLREFELNRKTENLTRLLEISNTLSTAHDINELMQKITDSAVKFLSNGTAAIYLIKGVNLYLAATHPPLPSSMPEEMKIAAIANHPHIARAIQSMQPVFIPDIKNSQLSEAERTICELRNIRSMIHLPLVYNNRVLGVLIIGSLGEVYHFSDDHLEFCRILALQASLKLEETKLAEEKIQHQAEIEKEILERKKAEELANFKQKFLANMSHEIRTPLTGILGVIDILSKYCKDEKHKEYIEILENTSQNLLEIVNQVLDYSKIQAGKLTLKPVSFNFRKLAHSLTFFYKNICNENVEINTHVDENIPELIKADKVRISQLLNNILNNAVKFTNNGSIIFKAELDRDFCNPPEEKNNQEESLCVKISIKDTGIGIDKQKQKKLFQPFVQLESTENWSYEGTGLGLSICKHLAELHGGQIGVESEPGKGSNFWFTFLAQVTTSENDSDFSSNLNKDNPAHNLRILLVEDKLVNQKVISILLSFLGHEIVPASNGQEAIDVYMPGKFDLILMDIQMPVMDGITAVKILREKFSDLPPIVGLSANAFEGDREKYISLGMDDYLTKPLKKDEFVEMAKRVFELDAS
jgi:two-component system, OmpR family, aerobic respiration control sensor histidine kinase ArcB